ncbi:MAG: exodeoxyribonuclease V subunit gamma, partial [Lachnospiraceae bacterium]|nr:exodeoxyribonuclease V subunit gamma [Lachnospiraceae bacterium]
LEKNLFRPKGEVYRNDRLSFKTVDEDSLRMTGIKTHGRQEEAGADSIEIYRLSDPRAELKFAAADIRRSVKADHSLRYKDVAVICANMESFRHYIADIFGTYDIPVFIDAKADVTQHHFVQFLSCLVELFVSDFSYDAVMRYAKSAFSPLTYDEADLLDNYLAATNVRGWSRLRKPFAKKLSNDDEALASLNSIREKLTAPFIDEGLPKRGTVEALTRSLYLLLVRHDCEEQLARQAKEYDTAGEEAKAKETEQMYGAVIGLLDKLVFLLGEEETGIEEYNDILNEGLSSLSVGVLPPQADAVMFGDIERTRLDAAHTIYFIGINDNAIPKTAEGGGLLTQAERMRIASSDIELAPSERERSFTQRFYLYLAMTKPTRRLVLSYSDVSAGGEGLRPSYLIGVVRKLFPQVAVTVVSDEELLFLQMTEGMLIDSLSDALRRYAGGRDEADEASFLEWLSYLKSAKPEAFEKLLAAGFYSHTDTPIQRAVMKAVHGGHLSAAVSRLERYAACAYSYFLCYELRLKERLQYEMDARDLGNLYHKALEYYARLLGEKEEDWHTISEARRNELLAESSKRAFFEWCEDRGEEAARQMHVYERMKKTLHRTVWALTEQVRQGDFAPNRFEVHLGELYAKGKMQVELSDGTVADLDGIVDRIDTVETDDAVYIKIIDYKSGNVDADLLAMYEGLQLQLILYLKAVGDSYERLSKKTVIPAAMLYYHIDNPVIEESGVLSDEELSGLVLKELKTKGLVAAESDVLYALDHGTSNAPYRSFSIPVEVKKDGELSKTSKVASRGQFKILMDYAVKKTKQIAEEIMAGNMAVMPYKRTPDDTACRYCRYHSVCGFEKYLDGFSYRRIAPKESADAVFEKMLNS